MLLNTKKRPDAKTGKPQTGDQRMQHAGLGAYPEN